MVRQDLSIALAVFSQNGTVICDIVNGDLGKEVTGVEIDISKEAILAASKNYADKIWAVADLTNTPFKDNQYDVIGVPPKKREKRTLSNKIYLKSRFP